ncbi:MAG: DUF4209 domain-containing protein [Kofleriaceae bacterium]|nr:DUF4209 domain-containing protein [Kofleriaceae bacterium]
MQRAEDGLVVASALLAGAKQPVVAQQITAERIEWMLERADADDGFMRAHLVQASVDAATAAGLTRLATVAKSRLRDAVLGATAKMKGVPLNIRLPAQLADAIHETAVRSPTPPFAVRSMAVAPWLTGISLEKFERAAREEAQTTLFVHLIPSVQYRDGKIAGLASSPEEKVREAVSRRASIELALAELAADHFLSVAFSRFDGETLLHSIGRPAWIDPRRMSWLARASERFAAQDFASCGAIVLTQYEGLLRDRVRAAGHHALKYDGGTTQDETLNSMLRVPAVRELLTEDHAWFVEFFLCRPDMGPNLRNELAHGNLDPRQLRPGVVLLIWMAMIRLVLLAPDEGEATATESPVENAAGEVAADAEQATATEPPVENAADAVKVAESPTAPALDPPGRLRGRGTPTSF